MKKSFIAYKVLLPALIVMLAVLVATFFVEVGKTDGTLEEGIAAILAVLIEFVPAIVFAVLGIALLVTEICLCKAKSKKKSIIVSLVLLCLLTPVMAFFAVASLLTVESLIYRIVAVLALLVFAATFVLACMLTHGVRRDPAAL